MYEPPDDRRLSAVALATSPEGLVPRVVARGYGETAEHIISLAREHGILVHDNPELVGLLMQLDLDDRTPPALYDVIADLLSWVKEMQS